MTKRYRYHYLRSMLSLRRDLSRLVPNGYTLARHPESILEFYIIPKPKDL